MPRLFTGLEVPQNVGVALSLKRGGLGNSRWIDPPNYHITLCYIGDIDNHQANEVVDCLSQMQSGKPFEVTLTHLGVFGGSRPRMLYAGLEVSPELAALHEAHQRALQQLGIKFDARKYTPHVTLARLNGVSATSIAAHIQSAGAFSPLTIDVTQIALYSARESIGGGPYVVEERYALKT